VGGGSGGSHYQQQRKLGSLFLFFFHAHGLTFPLKYCITIHMFTSALLESLYMFQFASIKDWTGTSALTVQYITQQFT
jgi:hypothetical protein